MKLTTVGHIAEKLQARRLANQARQLRQVAEAARVLCWQATTAELADPTPAIRNAALFARQADLAWARVAHAAETNAANAAKAAGTRYSETD